MKQPKYSPLEALERVKLMMGYDPSTTLTENEQRLKSLIKEDSQSEGAFKKITTACAGRAESEGTLDAASIAAALNRSFNYTFGTDDSIWRAQAAIMKKGNLDDFCNIVKEYQENFGESLVDGVIGDLDDEEIAEFMEAITSMKYKSEKMAKLSVDSTEQYNINWFKKNYRCIFDSDGNVDQTVRKNSNNYVYILIKGTSGKQYQVFSDGRVKKDDGTSTGKKLSCQGSKVSFIGESVQKKKLSEQIDDSSLIGGGKPDGGKKGGGYKSCSGNYTIGCMSEVIKKVQGCLSLVPDGKYGKKTKAALTSAGFPNGFTDADVAKICKTSDTQKKEVNPWDSSPDTMDSGVNNNNTNTNNPNTDNKLNNYTTPPPEGTLPGIPTGDNLRDD
jgi:hypothetical protein